MANTKFKAKKLVKFGVLVGIKESYLFLRNLYGIYSHPFLTTKRIMEKPDWSQAVLVFGLPLYLWLTWALVLLVSRIFIFGRLQFGILAKSSFLFVSFLASFFCLFLGYWLFKVEGKGK
ncbi:MAG TPA: hypothetical protein VMW25_01985 [Clostridia bacterium]|nr:hypothetical protein [Clostridia bacterium]